MRCNMNYEESLKQLKEDLDKAKNMKNKAEGTLEELKKQETTILNELEQLGVKPENLKDVIENLKIEIDELLKEANSLIPKDLFKKED